jgi:predicted naringenin-chalcone synthase
MTYILSLATASPDYCYQQEDVANRMLENLNLSQDQKESLAQLYRHSAIHTRYSVANNYDVIFTNPTTNERNDIYKVEAPKLAIKAAKKAFDQWDGLPQKITHVISVSCTGMMAPGIEYFLIKELGLSPSVGRLGINFMGCYGAFSGISAAKALAKENPHHRILLVCTELCSLHGQVDLSSDTLLANALFADGAGACIIGGDGSGHYLWEIIEQSSLLLENSAHLMSWEVANSGYAMKLSAKVPVLIRKNITPFARSLLGEKVTFEECHWAIHPGGKSIIQAVEKECALLPSQTDSSWKTLKEYGNMSSATFLFVLEKSLKTRSEWTLGLAFGPGLTMEGILLRSINDLAKKIQ